MNRLPTPALDCWRRELVARQRTRVTFDPLWRAACLEAAAAEQWHATPGIARACQQEARLIVKEAAASPS